MWALLPNKGTNSNDTLVKQQGTKCLPHTEPTSGCGLASKGASAIGALAVDKGTNAIDALLGSQTPSLCAPDSWRPTTTQGC
jgi:hypothetical protein